jgi:hypothetical protein
MLKCAVGLMAEAKGEAWVDKANAWQVIKQLDPTFDTRERAGWCYPPSRSAMAR